MSDEQNLTPFVARYSSVQTSIWPEAPGPPQCCEPVSELDLHGAGMERAASRASVQELTDDLPSTVRAGELFNHADDVWLQCTVRVITLSQEVGTRELELVHFVFCGILYN